MIRSLSLGRAPHIEPPFGADVEDCFAFGWGCELVSGVAVGAEVVAGDEGVGVRGAGLLVRGLALDDDGAQGVALAVEGGGGSGGELDVSASGLPALGFTPEESDLGAIVRALDPSGRRGVEPDDVGGIDIDWTFAVVRGLLFRKDEIGAAVDLNVDGDVFALGGSDMDFACGLRPVGSGRHPHFRSCRVIVVHQAADDDATISDIVNVWGRRETIDEFDQEPGGAFASAIAPEIAGPRALVAACGIESAPIDIGGEHDFGHGCCFRSRVLCEDVCGDERSWKECASNGERWFHRNGWVLVATENGFDGGKDGGALGIVEGVRVRRGKPAGVVVEILP